MQILGVDVGDDALDIGLHLGEIAEQRVRNGQIRRLRTLHAEALGSRRTQAGHGPKRLEPRVARS